MCYTLRQTIERRFKALGNSTSWTNFFRLPSCCFFICTIKVSHRPQRAAVRLKSQNVCRVPGTVSSRVLAKQYQLCYHYHYFCRSLLNWFCFMFLVFWPPGMWDLSSPTSDRTHTPCIGRWSLHNWTAREVPSSGFRGGPCVVQGGWRGDPLPLSRWPKCPFPRADGSYLFILCILQLGNYFASGPELASFLHSYPCAPHPHTRFHTPGSEQALSEPVLPCIHTLRCVHTHTQERVYTCSEKHAHTHRHRGMCAYIQTL